MYGIFLPIILLQNGYSLDVVLLFLILSSIVTIATSWFGQRLLNRKNVIYFTVVGILAEVGLLLLLLVQAEQSLFILLLIVTFEGLYFAFYYLSYYAITVHYTSKETTGRNIGNLTISIGLASIIAPLIGSHILGDSQSTLIIISIIILLTSLIPLNRIATPEVEERSKEDIQIFEIKLHVFNYSISSIFEVTVFTLWSIFAYVNDFTLLSIGSIIAATAGTRIIISYLIKDHLSNVPLRKFLMSIAVIGIAATSVYRFYIPSDIFITNMLMSLFYVIFQISVQTEIINSFKGNRTYYSSALLQMTTFTTRIPIYIIAIIIGLHNIILLPVLATIAYLLTNYRNLHIIWNAK